MGLSFFFLLSSFFFLLSSFFFLLSSSMLSNSFPHSKHLFLVSCSFSLSSTSSDLVSPKLENINFTIPIIFCISIVSSSTSPCSAIYFSKSTVSLFPFIMASVIVVNPCKKLFFFSSLFSMISVYHLLMGLIFFLNVLHALFSSEAEYLSHGPIILSPLLSTCNNLGRLHSSQSSLSSFLSSIDM